MSTSLSASHPKRYNTSQPRSPTIGSHPGQAQQPFRSSSPSTLNPYAQRTSNPESPSSLTLGQAQMSGKFESSPVLPSTSPLLPSPRICASDRDLTRYIDGDSSQSDIERKYADHRKTIQPHTFHKEQQYQQQRFTSSRQDAPGMRQRLVSSPSRTYTSSSAPDSSPNTSSRTASSPNIGSPASPQRTLAGPVNYGHGTERLEMDSLMRSVGDDQERALRKVLDERNSLVSHSRPVIDDC